MLQAESAVAFVRIAYPESGSDLGCSLV